MSRCSILPTYRNLTSNDILAIVKDDTLYIDGGVEIFYYDGAQILGYSMNYDEFTRSANVGLQLQTNISSK